MRQLLPPGRLPGQTALDARLGYGCVDAVWALDDMGKPALNVTPTRRELVERPWWRTLNPCDDA
ncbi:hypothetical protein [Sorangium sp. So ce854]|uniref:hypothetical protein n=1 Tax=Sorangium sp. So ce854 TaxID=3133322 RepID=UPI003F61A337